MNIAGPLTAFMQSLNGFTMATILSAILLVGLIVYSMDGHRNALFWLVGFMIVAGIVVAVAAEAGAGWFHA